MTATAHISFTDQEVLRCPFAAYRQLRQQDPVHQDPVTGRYVLTRYEDVRAVAADPETFSNRTGQLGITRESAAKPIIDKIFQEEGWPVVLTAVDNDPPEHRKMRGLFDASFKPNRIDKIKGELEAIIKGVIGCFADRSEIEVMQELAIPVPTRVIADQLGLPWERIADFKRWSDAMILASDPRATTEQMIGYAKQIIEMQQYMALAIEAAAKNPKDNIVSYVASASIDGEPATLQQRVWTCQNLLIAGNETTTSAIGSAILQLIQSGKEAELRADPEKINTFIEEVLRLEAPAQAFFRRTTRDVVIDAVTIPKDSIIELRWASANRDERQYERADELDLSRDQSRHMAFGYGIHFCAGANLARAELRIVIRQMLESFQNFRLAGSDAYEPIVHAFVRGPKKLKITFDKRRAGT